MKTLKDKVCIHKDGKGVPSYFYQTYCRYCDKYGNITFPEGNLVRKGECQRYEEDKS